MTPSDWTLCLGIAFLVLFVIFIELTRRKASQKPKRQIVKLRLALYVCPKCRKPLVDGEVVLSVPPEDHEALIPEGLYHIDCVPLEALTGLTKG